MAAIATLPETRFVVASPHYLATPFGPVQQPDFVNAVAGVITQLSMPAFFAAMRELEAALGRVRGGPRWGPRNIDLDLLVFGAERSDAESLRVPHPGIMARNFVLYPLRDVAPELDVPGVGRVRALAERVAAVGIRRLD